MKDQKQLLLKSMSNDVPVFVICGTDRNAIETMEEYYKIAQKNGCNDEFLQDMKLVLEDFKAFRVQEPEKVKLPDMSPQIDSSIYGSKEKEQSEKTPDPIQKNSIEKSKAEVESEINDMLKQLQETGGIKNVRPSMDNVTNPFINEYFAPEIQKLQEFYNRPDRIDYSGDFYETKASIQLKAGDILESKGLLPIGTTQAKLEEEGWNVVNLRENINKDKLLQISYSDNALETIYELNGNDENLVYKFNDRNGLTELFVNAENSAIEVSDYNRFASNYFDGTETDVLVSRENIDRDFVNAEKTAVMDNQALKEAVLEKLKPLELSEAKQIFESQVSSAILLTGGTTEKEVFDVFISRMKNDHDYDYELTKEGNYSFTPNKNSLAENKLTQVVNSSELDFAIKGVLNPDLNKTTPAHSNFKENKILESNQILM